MPKAGPDKKLCEYPKKDSEGNSTGPCQNVAGKKTPHLGYGKCHRHGGNSPSHLASAEKAMAQDACLTLGVQVPIDPVEGLLRLYWEVNGNLAFYRSLLDELDTHPEPDEYVIEEDEYGELIAKGTWLRGEPGLYGRTYHVSGTPTGEAKPHIILQMYNEEVDRAAKIAKMCTDTNISDRQMKMAEQMGNTLAEVINLILGDLKVLNLPETPAIVRKRLQAVNIS